jgi:hypothetical protein
MSLKRCVHVFKENINGSKNMVMGSKSCIRRLKKTNHNFLNKSQKRKLTDSENVHGSKKKHIHRFQKMITVKENC